MLDAPGERNGLDMPGIDLNGAVDCHFASKTPSVGQDGGSNDYPTGKGVSHFPAKLIEER